jgi:hypothetical protein
LSLKITPKNLYPEPSWISIHWNSVKFCKVINVSKPNGQFSVCVSPDFSTALSKADHSLLFFLASRI